MNRFELIGNGEIDARVDALSGMLKKCSLCPRECGVDRTAGVAGVCGTAGVVVSSSTAHYGEEPVISGRSGSGTIFFAGCNLRCLYCQNHEISQKTFSTRPWDRQADTRYLAEIMLNLQDRGCANINLVTPTHVSPMAVAAVAEASRRGLTIPIVWNSSGYESVDVIDLLDKIVDVWLVDIRYSDSLSALDCSKAPDYVEKARAAVTRMARLAGPEVIGVDGTLQRGIVIRLLVLPNDLAGVRETLDFIRDNLGTGTRISLMSQYFPSHLAVGHDLLGRKITAREYYRVVDYAERLGFDNLLIQEMEASDFYRPDFAVDGEPFSDARHFCDRGSPVCRGDELTKRV